MTRPSLPAILLLFAALLAATAQPAAADSTYLASSAGFNDPSMQDGRLALALVNDEVGNPFAAVEGTPETTPTPSLDIAAASAQLVAYEYTTRETAAGTLRDLPTDEGPRRTQTDVESALVQMTGFQRGFQVHVYGLEGDLDYQVETDGGVIQALAGKAEMRRGDINKDDPTVPPSGADSPDFAVVERAGPLLLQVKSAPHLRLTATGDMVVEVTGIHVRAQGTGTDAIIETGVWREPIEPLPAGSEAAVFEQRHVFLRMVLRGATLELGNDGGAPHVTWASREMTSAFTGPVTLEGGLAAAGQQAERTVLDAGSRLRFLPQGDQLAIETAPADLGTRGTLASVPAPASAALIGAGAILALGAAIGVGVLRRVLRLPALADVETALEEGEYRKAARMAGRILARLPGSEEALLGRAIALSKGGQPQAVVAELTSHLASRPASDGTLHYVLGLAQLETGRDAEGQASLREAVRLTPSLLAEVAPRLGKAFSVTQTTTRETNGYA
jgi:hypothetical protein